MHAAAQAVDIRRLISWIRTQEPDAKIGLNSMSLGGPSSLVASVEDGLTCAVLGVPVADLIEVLGGNGGLRARVIPQRDLGAGPPDRTDGLTTVLRPRVPIEVGSSTGWPTD